MAALIQTLSEDAGVLAILVLGLSLCALGVIWVWLRDGRIRGRADEIIELTQRGQADEARVLAHQEGGLLRAVQNSLSDADRSAEVRWTRWDWVWIAVFQLPWLLLFFYGAGTVRDPEAEARVQALAATMTALSLLVPFSLGSTLVFFQLGRATRQRLREVTAHLLAAVAATHVEAEASEDRHSIRPVPADSRRL